MHPDLLALTHPHYNMKKFPELCADLVNTDYFPDNVTQEWKVMIRRIPMMIKGGGPVANHHAIVAVRYRPNPYGKSQSIEDTLDDGLLRSYRMRAWDVPVSRWAFEAAAKRRKAAGKKWYQRSAAEDRASEIQFPQGDGAMFRSIEDCQAWCDAENYKIASMNPVARKLNGYGN